MSILLDALKKSEEQRQLGAAPDIHNSATTDSLAMEVGHRWLPLSMMALSLVLMLWGGLKQLAEPESLIPAAQLAGRAESTATAERRDGEVGQRQAEPAASVAPELRTPVESMPGQVDGRQAAGEAEPGAAERTRLKDAVVDFRAEQPATAAESRPSGELLPTEADPAAPGAQSRVTRAASGDEAEGPHISEPISIYELPQRVRDNLPEIRITVLVFAREPDDRFLLVNGKRLREKEDLESGVQLDEIRRDGAVFLYRNYRFMVKG